ncbi:mannose-1-phosphate guanylyltransferase/mannose-6-phosphate isomerase [Brevundimonas alba]|uniref:Mannose-1-phosphate guanylyltransferase/mannose-6-phosphate isomerase n=1 Tax=Brevundimonas alba TaxID=74314 RepID=A0A7X5YJW7_9CAUL|nr:AGE family epimerase/isomerase [Brevundimonas alba]NJC41283.1 mannose-1-phosphate guanylyltransferase/mannose-6-phosphate isomerase [Brevundimonas alba]
MTIYPVIMCGGAGSRLWPASRPGRPKQFLALTGEHSLFQSTVLRVAPLASDGRVIVVAGAGHADAVAAQLAEIEAEAIVLLEPEARDSGPAMAAAAAFIEALDPTGVAAIMASDHHIPDAEAFREAVRIAATEAAQGRIVTLGVTPTSPSSAYGYICPSGPGLAPVKRFVEKPDTATAARYVAEGYLWNSGNFIVAARTLMDDLAAHAPEIGVQVRASLPASGETGPVIRLGDAFRSAPKISIDYAVMEKSGRTSVLPVHFAWSDVGAWDSVMDTGEGQSGIHIAVDSESCLVRVPDGMVVATLGVSNLAVIVEPDAVLVCALDRAQQVKAIVDRIRTEAPGHADIPERREAAPFARFGDWMRTAALPLWTTLGVHPDGAFVEALTLEGRHSESRRRARVQSRQIFVLCRAGALGWQGPWRERAEAGLNRFLDGYVREDGAIRNALNTDGTVLDDTAVLYEQAFALLALAAAHEAGILPERCEAQARTLLDRLEAERLPGGGWREAGDHPFQANANMHLFEAAQAWSARGVDDRWNGIADTIASLALTRLIDPERGFLREFFDADWRPAPGEDGHLVEPGHQFEWSWLLSRHALARQDAAAMAAARKLYAHGLRGVDPRRGVAIDQLDDVLKVRSAGARLWPQTEWLRAALAMAALSDGDERRERLAEAGKAMRGLNRYLCANGTWRDKLQPDGSFVDEPAPASSLYHIIGAFDEVCVAAREVLIADAPVGLA